MSNSNERLQKTLLDWMSREDNKWSVWYGDAIASAQKLISKDGSQAYIRQISVSQEIMAYDPNISLSTELFKATWVPVDGIEPDANASWWISSDNGLTKQKVTFVAKKARAKRSHWNIILKNA